MGLVHFLHGNPKPPKLESGKKILCRNKKCLRVLSETMLMNGKKVCPYCKTPIEEEISCSSCGRPVSEYIVLKKKKVCPYCENPFTPEEIKHLKRAE